MEKPSNTDIRRFVDKDVDENQTYEYRIKSKNTNGESSWSMKIEKIETLMFDNLHSFEYLMN